MLIRRKPPEPKKSQPLFIRRRPQKARGFTTADGFKTHDAPHNWPFGCITQDQRLAEALTAVLKKHKL